jgi:hypothetical protein
MLMLGGFFAWFFYAPPARLDLSFKGFSHDFRPSRRGLPITYALFELRNRGQQTLYYEGSPLPVYSIETEQNGRWSRNLEEEPPEVLSPIFPRHSYKFKILVPDTTNHWRIAVRWIRPSSAPVTFRRFFPPKAAFLVGPDVSIQLRPSTALASTSSSGGGGGMSLIAAELGNEAAAR